MHWRSAGGHESALCSGPCSIVKRLEKDFVSSATSPLFWAVFCLVWTGSEQDVDSERKTVQHLNYFNKGPPAADCRGGNAGDTCTMNCRMGMRTDRGGAFANRPLNIRIVYD